MTLKKEKINKIIKSIQNITTNLRILMKNGKAKIKLQMHNKISSVPTLKAKMNQNLQKSIKVNRQSKTYISLQKEILNKKKINIQVKAQIKIDKAQRKLQNPVKTMQLALLTSKP